MKSLRSVALVLFVMSSAATALSAQTRDIPTCRGSIYSTKEVTRRARINEHPNYDAIYEAFGRNIQARAVLDVVLCRSGRVTDIKVIEISPPEIAEFVVKAISILRFTPAELNWHTVSQRQRLEYLINQDNRTPIDSASAAGRLVESVDVIGNRRLTAKQIFFWIETRPGDPYSEEQLKRDFEAVLASGYFDKTQTRVMIEDGVRGGVRVIFEVVELPVIGEVNFENLKVERSVVLAALKKEQIDLQPGKPYDVATLKSAVRIIKLVIAEIGQTNSNVETKVENVSATKVNLTFVITPNQ